MLPHKEILQLLAPLEMGGDNPADQAVEGALFDRAGTELEALGKEMFPDSATRLIARWEARYGLADGSALPLQRRRDLVVARKRSRGSLSIPFFVGLAATLGYQITIDEKVDNDPDKWRVNVQGTAIYYFRAGISAAGDRVTWWDMANTLESIFQDLKPATSQVVFNYL
jgi:uncharacterized protein YmfQ (DUF2313 family)